MSATCSASCEPLAARRRLAGHVPSHCSNQIPPNRRPSSSYNYSLWHTFDDCGMARVLLCFSQSGEKISEIYHGSPFRALRGGNETRENSRVGICTTCDASTDTPAVPFKTSCAD